MQGIKITSPDKVVFTDPKITKMEIIEYYEKAAPHMLPYMKGRILALVRCPSGIKGECFYKKNPDIFDMTVAHNKGYISVATVSELINQVQLNTLEFHTWGSTEDNLDKPDIMVFDLDPDEGMSLAKIRQGVKDLKSVLDELSLISYLKTSGGKGYHIVVPFSPSADWETFRCFAKNIASVMEAKWPSRYTSNVRKNSRAGKIFVDWIRNTKGATSIAPYSIRAKHGAPVAVPLAWDELGKIAPRSTDIKKAVKRFESKDPWLGFEKTQKIQRLK